MEFFPEENTVIQIEGTHRKITKITKTKIIIEEKMRQMGQYSIHKVGHFAQTLAKHALFLILSGV